MACGANPLRRPPRLVHRRGGPAPFNYEDQSKAVGKRMRARRLELGLGQRAIAEPGTSYAYISRIESGARNPSVEALIAIAEKLEMTALARLTGDKHALCPVCGRGHTDE